MNPAGFSGCFLALWLLPTIALSKDSIQTRIIPGGEVSITELKARYDRQSISVSGTGFEVFPHQTCGHPEIAFLDANGRILLRKDAEYRTFHWYAESPRKTTFQNRIVSSLSMSPFHRPWHPSLFATDRPKDASTPGASSALWTGSSIRSF
jgi:hypothetical protein